MIPSRFSFFHRRNLGDELFPIFAVVIWPTVYSWNFASPVAVPRVYSCSPLQGRSTPWVLSGHLFTLPDAVEEVDDKQNLESKSSNGRDRNKLIQVIKV